MFPGSALHNSRLDDKHVQLIIGMLVDDVHQRQSSAREEQAKQVEDASVLRRVTEASKAAVSAGVDWDDVAPLPLPGLLTAAQEAPREQDQDNEVQYRGAVDQDQFVSLLLALIRWMEASTRLSLLKCLPGDLLSMS